MVNIEMFRHPKYYKELRKRALDERNKTDQAISPMSDGSPRRRATGPGPKLTRRERGIYKSTALAPGTSNKQQAVDLKINLERVRKQYTSDKHQATSSQATSDKRQAPSNKRQA